MIPMQPPTPHIDAKTVDVPACSLPPELVFICIRVLAPTRPNVILSPENKDTQLLFTFRKVCKATNEEAMRILRPHGIFIGSIDKALWLENELTIDRENLPSVSLFSDISNVTNLFLGAINLSDLEDPEEFVPAGDIIATVSAVKTILEVFSKTVRNLVIDMPLHYLVHYYGLEGKLHDCMQKFVALEECASLFDDLALSIDPSTRRLAGHNEPSIWTWWPKLRRLLLYGAVSDTEARLWVDLNSRPNLEMLVLVDAEGHAGPGDELEQMASKYATTIVLLSAASQQLVFGSPRPEPDAESQTRLLLAEAPKSSEDTDESIGCDFEYIDYHVLNGTIWDKKVMNMRVARGGTAP